LSTRIDLSPRHCPNAAYVLSVAHEYRRRRSRRREHEDAAQRRLRLLTEQLAGQASEPDVDSALDPSSAVGRAQIQATPSDRKARAPDVGWSSAGTSPGARRGCTADTAAGHAPALKQEPTAPPSAVHGRHGRHAARPLPWHRRLLAALIDRAPVGALGLTSTHVMVLALVGLGAVAMTVWWVTAARPQAPPDANAVTIATPVPTSEPGVEAAPAPTADPVPSGSSAESAPTPSPVVTPAPVAPDAGAASQVSDVVVDVAGKVRRPGIVVLPPGSRVADALEAAGGVRPGVDTAALNLARPLLDGEQVLVGLPPLISPPSGSASPATGPAAAATAVPGAPTALVNLNTATIEQLDTLPGVGPVTGQAILDWRTEHGAFTSVDELLEVDGIGDATLADLRDLVTV
jgi:competence protein ComEA